MTMTDNTLGATLPKKWLDDFTIALRAREVPGTQIGDAIKTVEEYCAESGQTPQEAFGAPGEYAAALQLGTEAADQSLAEQLKAQAPGALGLLGLAIPPAIDAIQDGRPLSFTLGTGIFVVILIGFALTLLRWTEALLNKKWLGIAFMVAAFYGAVFAPIMFRQSLFEVPPVFGIVVGLAGLAFSVTHGWVTWKEDPIVDPTAPVEVPRRSRFAVVTILLFPVLVAALSVVAWLT